MSQTSLIRNLVYKINVGKVMERITGVPLDKFHYNSENQLYNEEKYKTDYDNIYWYLHKHPYIKQFTKTVHPSNVNDNKINHH